MNKFYATLNVDTMRWTGTCSKCGGRVDLCAFEEHPGLAAEKIEHQCVELTHELLRDLYEAGGIEAVADAMGVPPELR